MEEKCDSGEWKRSVVRRIEEELDLENRRRASSGE